jgi:hypothetical protein
MGRPSSGRPPSKVFSLRLDAETFDWLTQYGDQAPDLVRGLIEESRATMTDKAIDRKLVMLKDRLTDLETEALEVRKTIRSLEDTKAQLQASQLSYLTVRQKLLERYLQGPEHFQGWLTGPANEHLISEAKFNSPREVAEFCKAEVNRRRGGQC